RSAVLKRETSKPVVKLLQEQDRVATATGHVVSEVYVCHVALRHRKRLIEHIDVALCMCVIGRVDLLLFCELADSSQLGDVVGQLERGVGVSERLRHVEDVLELLV